MRSTVGTRDSANLKMFRRQKMYLPRETVHELSAGGGEAVRILEISFGELEEVDIVQLVDVYDRAGADGYVKERGGGSRDTDPT